MTEFATHKVLLADDATDGGYSVSVLPTPQGVGHDRAFADYYRARAYARLLRLQHGWPIVDRAGPPSGAR